jgi:hypothetical protein
VDLRSEPGLSGEVPVVPVHELVEGWGEVLPTGTWSIGNRAVIRMTLAAGGHRGVLVQCRPDRREESPPWLLVRVNGVECGPVHMTRMMSVRRVEVPEGVIGAGENSIELSLVVDGDPARPAAGRRMLARRMVLSEDVGSSFKTAINRRPVTLDRDDDTVLVRVPGRLWVRFDVPRPESFLYARCPSRGARAPVSCGAGVARWFGSPARIDPIAEDRFELDGGKDASLRLYLGNHTGPAVFWIDAEGVEAGSSLVLESPTVGPWRRR